MPNEGKKLPARRSFISLETKVQILDRLKNGERPTHVARSLRLNEATIRTIKQNEEKIRTAVAAGSPVSVRVASRTRATIIEKMEKSLSDWISECNDKQVSLDCHAIKKKALSIYEDLKANGETPVSPEFVASKGWFERFKKRFSLRKTKVQGESTSAPVTVPAAIEEDANFTLQSIEEGLNLAEQLQSYFWRVDPSIGRSMKFQRELRKCMAPYREIYEDLLRKGAAQESTDSVRTKRGDDEDDDDESADAEYSMQPSERVCLVMLSGDEEDGN